MRSLASLQKLYHELRVKLDPLRTREVLLAAASMKTSRLGGPDRLLDWLETVADAHRVSYVEANYRVVTLRDIGKGGWANQILRKVPRNSPQGDRLIYLANSKAVAIEARDAEAAGREANFGAVLGIPACCTEFYLHYQQHASQKQNDFVPIVLDNTNGRGPYNFWNNYVAQYFGYSLLSFFPCSFNCARAAEVSKQTYEFLSKVNRKFADAFVHLQRQSILYTEYRGIFLFEGGRHDGHSIRYNPNKIRTTLQSAALMQPLLAGSRLTIHAKHLADIRRGSALLKTCRGDNVSVCLF
jgi:hypothetical protein